MPQDALRKIVAGRHLTRQEAADLMTLLMDGRATAAQIGALLTALRMKGETVEEIAGFAQGMRSRVVPVRPTRTPLLDTCGTGGGAVRMFNVSTAAAFVAAAGGIAVAKHGNRAASGICGSADVLEALGVRLSLTPVDCAACIDEVGIGFLYAPAHHPAVKNVSGPRREIGIRSVFNLLGPLANPAGATRQVIGVYDPALCSVVARSLQLLGSERVCAVYAEIGADEVSTIGPTRVAELRDGQIAEYTLTPSSLDILGPEPTLEDLAPAPTAAENALLLRDVLTGDVDDRRTRARRDLVAVNAAAALRVGGVVESWPAGVRMARQLIASGEALAVLDRLTEFTSRVLS